ncbi:MAG: DNA polymerase III subunit beta [Verrucomicrobia bacterium]|nr:DNA polymerase III subunit beta [Verrucomicrobiota bacterium]
MKFTVNKELILEALQKVQAIVNPRTTLPILSNVLFQSDGKKLTLSATDLEVSVRTSIDAKVDKAGGTTLPARRLLSIVRELPSAEIEVDTDEKDIASIKCGPSFFKLVGISEDEFPPPPKFEGGKSYKMEQGVFKEMLQKTGYAASTDETRYILNGVLLSFQGEKLIVVATDGRRLALVEQEVEFPKKSEGDLVVPSKTVNELIRTLGDEGELTIQATENQVAFEFDDILIISKLIEGTFPNFRQVIPAQCEERVTIEREILFTALKRAALLTNDQSNSVKLLFTSNKLQIVTETPDVGESKETIPVKFSGKDVSVAFNPEFMMDPLKCLQSDEIHIEMTDELSPGVIKADVPFLYVLMPMRMS